MISAFVMVLGCNGDLRKEKIIHYLNNESLPYEEVHVDYVYDIYNFANIVGDADYVFVGQVKDYIKTNYGYADKTPRTFYSVKVIENIKGELIQDNDIEVIKIGGIDQKARKFIIYDLDLLPKINQYYIFAVFADAKGQITAVGPTSSILLSDKDNYQNCESYKDIIKAYENPNTFDRERHQSKYDKNYNE